MKFFAFIYFFLFSTICFSQQKNIYDIARSGTVEQLIECIKNNPGIENTPNENGFTPLILACYKFNAPVGDYLIKNSKVIDFTTPMGTALMACVYKNNVELGKKLIENKANLNLTDDKGDTALMLAAQFENETFVKILLENKADKTLINKQGKTAFEYATFTKNKKLINLLKN